MHTGWPAVLKSLVLGMTLKGLLAVSSLYTYRDFETSVHPGIYSMHVFT